jgi:hypothetical protein
MRQGDGSEHRKTQTGKTQPKPRAFPRAAIVKKAILAFEKKLETKNVTVGDFVRLLQLQKEIDGDKPKDIKVTWVEPGEMKSSEK